MATVQAQRTALEAALTAGSIKNTSDWSAFQALQPMVVILGNGSDALAGISFKMWGFRLSCTVPLTAKGGTTALTTLTLAVLAIVNAPGSGCQLVSVGPESIGTTEGGIRYLAADVNVNVVVTI